MFWGAINAFAVAIGWAIMAVAAVVFALWVVVTIWDLFLSAVADRWYDRHRAKKEADRVANPPQHFFTDRGTWRGSKARCDVHLSGHASAQDAFDLRMRIRSLIAEAMIE